MSNNKDFKVKNGIKPTVYHEGVGTVVSGSGDTTDLASGKPIDLVDLSSTVSTTTAEALEFKPDGTKVYYQATSEDMWQFSLSTAWDITTATYDTKTFDFSPSQGTSVSSFFKPDGTKLYYLGALPAPAEGIYIYEYNLSTAWDISTLSDAGTKSTNLFTTLNGNVNDLFFKPDGTKVYTIGPNYRQVAEFSLSTAWDATTISHTANYIFTNDGDYTLRSIMFSSDGTKWWAVGTQDELRQYSLSTPWDITTSSYDNVLLNLQKFADYPEAIALNSEETNIYFAKDGKVWQFDISSSAKTLDLSTGNVFEVTPTSDLQIKLSNPSDSGTLSTATLVLNSGISNLSVDSMSYDNKSFDTSTETAEPSDIYFSSDGTKMFIFDDLYTNNHVFQYDLTTAWDVSTAEYNNVSLSLTDVTQLEAGQFSADGTKMYISEAGLQDILQYTLSTAWDISTASYDSITYDPNEIGQIDAFTFSHDGTKMYLSPTSGGVVYQYSLSTPWSLSNVAYDGKSFDFSTQNSNVKGLYFTEDGYNIISIDYNSSKLYYYQMASPFDISTAHYTDVSFSLLNEDTQWYGFYVEPSQSKLYAVTRNLDTVFQYTIGTSSVITYEENIEWSGGTAPTSPAAGETDVLTLITRDGGTTYQAVQAIDGAV